MKKVTLLIISLFATLLLVAQGSVPQMEILDQVAAKTEKYVGLKIDFTLQMVQSDGINLLLRTSHLQLVNI